MVQQSNRDEERDKRAGADDSTPTPALERIWIDKPVRSRAPKPDYVAMLECLPAANPASVDERALRRFEIDDVVTPARVSDGRVAICDARIRKMQWRPFRRSNHRFIAREQQQPRACALAIESQQTCRLRPQHLQLASRGSFNAAAVKRQIHYPSRSEPEVELMQMEVEQIEMNQTEMKLTELTLKKHPCSMGRGRLHYWQRARLASFEDPAGSYSARFDSSGICTS